MTNAKWKLQFTRCLFLDPIQDPRLCLPEWPLCTFVVILLVRRMGSYKDQCALYRSDISCHLFGFFVFCFVLFFVLLFFFFAFQCMIIHLELLEQVYMYICYVFWFNVLFSTSHVHTHLLGGEGGDVVLVCLFVCYAFPFVLFSSVEHV